MTRLTARKSKRIEESAPEVSPHAPEHEYDSEAMTRRHAKLYSYIQFERDYQSENRMLMSRDEAYYDHDQLTPDQKATLEARGQLAEANNIIKPVVDWLVGTERRMRYDEHVLPREKNDSKSAQSKTSLLKYLSDANRSPYERSTAFSESVKAGVSWLEVGIRPEFDDGELLMERHVSWRHVYHDSLSRRMDMDDARYVVRFRYVDLDVAKGYFPERAGELERAANYIGDRRYQFDEDELWYGGENLAQRPIASGVSSAFGSGTNRWMHERKQVKIYEVWHKELKDCVCLADGPWKNTPLQELDGPLQYEVWAKGWKTKTVKKQRMRVTILTDFSIMLDADSPYRHNRFPIIPVWCYRKASDGLPYGIVRGLIGMQDSFNKLQQKALHAINTKRTMYEDGALDPEDEEQLETEVARPDSIIKTRQGALNKIRIETDAQTSSQALQLAQINERLLHNASGVTPENLGRGGSSESGRAVLAKAEQGSMVTAEIFDNLVLSAQMTGELKLANVEQFYTERKVIRLLGDQDAADFTVINEEFDDDGKPVDPITAARADYVISHRDARATARQAQYEQFGEMLGKLAPYAPDVTRALIDVLVEMSDMPLREIAVKRIRQITGMRDEGEELTPQEQAQMQQQAAAQEAMATIQKAMEEAKLANEQAKAAALQANASLTEARALKEKMQSAFTATQIAGVIGAAPNVGQVASEILAASDEQGGMAPVAVPASPEQPTTGGYVDVDRLNMPTR